MSSFANTLKSKVQKNTFVLITPYTPFNYETIGLSYEQVRVIFGPLTEDSISLDSYISGQQKYWGKS